MNSFFQRENYYTYSPFSYYGRTKLSNSYDIYGNSKINLNNNKLKALNDIEVSRDINKEFKNNEIKNNNDTKQAKEPYTNKNSTDSNTRSGINLGPISISKNGLSIFGIHLKIDDIIILCLIIFLIAEKNIDYMLLIILALILFDLSFDTIKKSNIIGGLFDAT